MSERKQLKGILDYSTGNLTGKQCSFYVENDGNKLEFEILISVKNGVDSNEGSITIHGNKFILPLNYFKGMCISEDKTTTISVSNIATITFKEVCVFLNNFLNEQLFTDPLCGQIVTKEQLNMITNVIKQFSASGGSKKMPSKEKVYINGKSYIVYTGLRGGRYVKTNNKFVSLSSMK